MPRQRVAVLSILLALAVAALGGLAATADEPVDGESADRYPGGTLVTVQAYGLGAIAGLAREWSRHGRTA